MIRTIETFTSDEQLKISFVAAMKYIDLLKKFAVR